MDSHQPGADERRIADAFNDYFANFGIRIAPDDVIVGTRRTITDERSGWVIIYRVDADASGAPRLEFYATNRRTNDRHARIAADGEGEHLEALAEMVILNSGNAVGEFQARNEDIAARLRERGLYPHGLED